MSTLYLDLETVPLAASMAAPYPDADRLPPSNYKNPEAIASWREKDRATWLDGRTKECSLTPRLGRVLTLGWAVDDQPVCVKTARSEEEEVLLLDGAWEMIESADRLVTFNGNFDLRFILVRSIVHGIRPHIQASSIADWFKRYTTWPHFDCRSVLTGWDDKQSGTLHEWSATFGIQSEDTCSGADIYALSQVEEWDAIEAHCRSDVTLTRELYRRIAHMFDRSAA